MSKFLKYILVSFAVHHGERKTPKESKTVKRAQMENLRQGRRKQRGSTQEGREKRSDKAIGSAGMT
jgi:hypothetical protein